MGRERDGRVPLLLSLLLGCVALGSQGREDHNADTAAAVERALRFLDASAPENWHRFAADYLVAASAVERASAAHADLAVRVKDKVLDAFLGFTEGLPDTVSPSVVRGALGDLFGLQQAGARHPALEAEVALVLAYFNDSVLFGFPVSLAHCAGTCGGASAPSHGTECLEQGAPVELPTWEVWNKALVLSFVAEAAGADFFTDRPEATEQSRACAACAALCCPASLSPDARSGAGRRDSKFLEVLRWLPLLRESYDRDADLVTVMHQTMGITHVILALTNYDPRERLPQQHFSEERDFLLEKLPSFIRLGSADLVGESVDALRRLGLDASTHPLLKRATTHLLSTQRENGSWENDYHATVAAMWALLPAQDSDQRPHAGPTEWRMGAQWRGEEDRARFLADAVCLTHTRRQDLNPPRTVPDNHPSSATLDGDDPLLQEAAVHVAIRVLGRLMLSPKEEL